MTTSQTQTGIVRRTLLRAAAVTGLAVGVGSAPTQARLQEDADIVLEGRTTGWVGVEPDEIDGDQNPTLELEVDETYVLVWENEDGVGHNFVIEDDDGENLVETEIISGSGETQTVEFTAEEGMAEYYCAPHPQSMRGDVELVGTDEAEETDDPDDDPDEDVMEFAAVVEEHIEFTLADDGWLRQDSSDGAETEDEMDADNQEVNPPLDLEAGSAYVISWTNELETSEELDDADETDADDPESDLEGPATELVLETDDGEEFLRSESLEPGETGAITFAAPAELVAYRDEETDAEGDIEVAADEDSTVDNDV